MPQELRVVRCFQCSKFQVDIVKKANKWMCKVCGVKQSLMKEYFRGTGKECRSIVQELTGQNIATDDQEAKIAEFVLQNDIQLPKPSNHTPVMERFIHETTSPNDYRFTNNVPSKWDSFVPKKDEEDVSDGLELEKALAQVSDTHFDREKVHVSGTKKYGENRSSKWSNFRQAREAESIDDDTGGSMHLFEDRQKSIIDCGSNNFTGPTISEQAVNVNRQITSHTSKPKTLINFHHKKPVRRVQQCVPVGHSDSFSTVGDETNTVCKKRKHLDVTATPLMNFGKRHSKENSTESSAKSGSMFETVPKRQNQANSGSGSASKWDKFVLQDEETNENHDDFFVS